MEDSDSPELYFSDVTNNKMTDKETNLDKGTFLVNTLGVIFDPSNKKFLIVKRENDKHIQKLKWVFPGGRPNKDGDLEENFEKVLHERTGLKIKSLGPVFSRIFDSDKNLLLIYYLCEAMGGEIKLNEEYSEHKWVSPEELEDHFTTSFDPRLKEFIMNLK